MIILNNKILKEFQIYIKNLFIKNKLSNIYFNEIYIIWMKRYFRQKFELFKWLYLFISWIFLIMTFSLSMKCRFEEKLMLMNSMSTYIRVIINRMNVRYSVVKMTEKKIEKKVMKMTNKMMKMNWNQMKRMKLMIEWLFIVIKLNDYAMIERVYASQ